MSEQENHTPADAPAPEPPAANVHPSGVNDEAVNVETVNDPTRIPLLILTRKALYVDETLERMRPNYGRAVNVTWNDLVRFLSQSREGDPARYPNPNTAKRQWGAWAGGRFRDDHRTEMTFVSTWLLVVDIDGNADVGRLARLLGKYRLLIHTTYKSTVENTRVRLVFMLSKECRDRKLYKRAHAAVRALLTSRGLIVDDGASEAARMHYVPMHRPGYVPVFHTHDGELLDIDEIAVAAPAPARNAPARSDSQDHAGAVRWASEQLRAAPEGTRHNVRRNKARWLSELGVDEATVLSALFDEHRDDETARKAVMWGIAKGRGE
jgi:hypothetical protein